MQRPRCRNVRRIDKSRHDCPIRLDAVVESKLADSFRRHAESIQYVGLKGFGQARHQEPINGPVFRIYFVEKDEPWNDTEHEVTQIAWTWTGYDCDGSRNAL